jgi:anaerobic selenocysteine-containing dehydrogenase
MATVRTTCPYDCPDTCGLLVEVEEGRAVATRGDPEHPYSRGSLCSKMTRYEATVHSPRRLVAPLVRTGAKGAGAFRRASWDEALELVAGRWKQLVARHGAEAILPYSYAGTMGLVQRNAGHAFFHRLGASRLDRTICSPAKSAGWKAVMGDSVAPHPDAAERSDLVVLWGINAAATNVHFLSRVKQARARGAAVWAVETYRTPTAALADEVVLVRPGSDGALALGILHVLAREGLVDRAFVGANVLGFEDLEAQVLPRFEPERVAALTGLAPGRIEDLARRYGRARAPFIRLGSGLSRYGNGAMNVRCIVALPAAVGAWARDGGGLLGSTSAGQAFDLSPVTREDLLPRPAPRTVNMNQLGEALAPSFGPPVHSLYVYHSNPAAVAPDQNAVLAGLAREDLFTVVHERFLTDTARWADVVLPATSSLEHADLYGSYGHYAVQRARPAIPPVGESRSNWEVFRALARRMGFEEEIFGRTADELVDRLLAAPSAWRAGLDRAALDAGRAVELAAPAGPRWRTPSGRIELRNDRLRHPLPDHLPTHEDGGSLPLRLQTGVTPYALNSSFMERDELVQRQRGMRLRLAPEEAAVRGLADGDPVEAWNERGAVRFILEVTRDVPPGLAVAEGVFWTAYAPGDRTVNALTSQRLTDEAGGSTFYDARVDVRPLAPAAADAATPGASAA